MSEARAIPQGEILRLRKERIHSTMLVEVLALLIFISMAFAFVLRDDAIRTNPWKQRYDQIERELRAARAENNQLRREVSELERANRQLLRTITGTVAANDTLLVNKTQWREMIERLANAEAVVARQQVDNKALRDRLAGRGGSDLPNCTVSPTDFIVRIDLSQSSYTVTPVWPATANSSAARVPGLLELASRRPLSRGAFSSLSRQVKAWGRSQPTPCNFRAVVYPHHQDMAAYRAQQSLIGDVFYPAYR